MPKDAVPRKGVPTGGFINIVSQTRKILKLSYYRNCCIDHDEILHNDKDQQLLFVGDPNMPQTNPRWQKAAILKDGKIAISVQRIGQFC